MIEQFEFAGKSQLHSSPIVSMIMMLIFAAIIAFSACAWGNYRRRRILDVFGIARSRALSWIRACETRRWIRATLLTLALTSVLIALLRPRGNPVTAEFQVRSRDVAVVIDVSRSMLAEDLRPNRLDRVKEEVGELTESLRGDRIGVIAFAGSAETLCPLTSNYSYVKSVLRSIDTESADRGGTDLGDAIRKAIRLLGYSDAKAVPKDDESDVGETVLESEQKEQNLPHANILLITDGENNHGLPAKLAVADVAARGIGLFIVGIGSQDGTPIPITKADGSKDWIRHKGEIVRTKLNEQTLMGLVAQAPRGQYLPVGTNNPDLVDFYQNGIAQEEGAQLVEEHVTWTEFFQPFLLAGLFFYFLFLLVPERPLKQRSISLVEATEA